MTYKLLKIKITNKNYKEKEEVQAMLDVFLMGNRITLEQYEELTALLNSQD